MNQFLLRWRLILWLVVSLFAWHGLAVDSWAQPTPPPFDPAAVPTPVATPITAFAAGSYEQNCAPCHGLTGNSDGETTASLPAPPPRFADPATVWERSPAEYFHTTKFGRIQNLMPPWNSRLDDEQIWQAVYYAWSLHTDQATIERGAELYAQSCAACHGPQGAGDGPEASGTLPNFADSATMIVQSPAALDSAWQQAHAELGQDWSAEDRRAVLDYIRTFSYTPPWISGYQPGDGVVTGQVVQGTADGGSVASLPVTLTAFVNFEPAATFTTTTDSAGAFQFEELSTAAGMAYLATARYAGIQYNSDIALLSPLTNTAAISLPVFETTEDGSGILLRRANWLLDVQSGAVRAGVIVVAGNELDRTFIGTQVEGLGQPATLALSVPPGATNLQFEDGVLGGRYQQLGDRIFDIAPIAPGVESRQVIYSYQLPLTGTTATVTQGFLYAVDTLNLLIPDLPGLEIEVPGLTEVDPQIIQNINFRRWTGENLAAPTVEITLRGIPEAGSAAAANAAVAGATNLTSAVPQLQPFIPAALGAVLVLALAGLLYLPLSRQRGQSRRDLLQEEQELLISEIAELDDQQAAGELTVEQWTQERARLKSALLSVAQELKRE